MSSQVFLSILIPVYNWDVSSLIRSLHDQCSRLPAEDGTEIIAVDDGSERKYGNAAAAAELDGVMYRELTENKGRAAARNHLFNLSQGKYILFLDADMLPDEGDFVRRYLELAKHGIQVVCGGISYRQVPGGDPRTAFHRYKSMRTEALPAARRNREPWRYVFTSNIMLRRDIMESVRFDPSFTSYGFEDIEWGMRLRDRYRIEHVDNTCTHTGLMGKEEVLTRMREAVPNQYLLYTLYPETVGSAGAVKLSRYVRHLPGPVLRLCDRLITILFARLTWNRFLYLLFQLDKVILLAVTLREKGGSDGRR